MAEKKKATLASIAKALGVSKVAVHKALTDKKGVSEELRKKIKEYARSVNYEGKKTHIEIANKKFLFFIDEDFFLTPSEQFYSSIFYYLSAECNNKRNTLQVAFLEKEDPEIEIEKTIKSFRPDGVFFAGEMGMDLMEHLRKISVPKVFIDYYSALYEGNYVYIDNYRTAYRLTKYLMAKGHRRIGFIGDVDSTSAVADRYYGYLKAMREERVALNPVWHINTNIEKSGSALDIPKDNFPSAFICHCDAAAQWLYTAISLQGLAVPADVSVASFDNTPLCSSLMPELTSIGPDKKLYAQKAFETMSKALANPTRVYQWNLVPRLAERGSVAKKA